MAEESNWNFTLVKGGSFSAEMLFEDEAGEPVPLDGNVIRMLVKSVGNEQIQWSTSSGEFVILPATGRVRFSLSISQIQALTFRAANLFILINDFQSGIEGTIIVK